MKAIQVYPTCFDVESFVIEGNLVEWLFRLKVYLFKYCINK